MFRWLARKPRQVPKAPPLAPDVGAAPGVETEAEAEIGLETRAEPVAWAPTVPMPVPDLRDAQAMQRESELRRLAALQARGQAAYQYVADTAARICQTPIAAITLLDGDMVWVQAAVNLPFDSLPISQSFCPRVLAQGAGVMVVPDAQGDPALAQLLPVRQAPHLRFYAGAPVTSARGVPLGTVAVADTTPRELTPVQLRTLQLLAQQIALLLEARAPSTSDSPGVHAATSPGGGG